MYPQSSLWVSIARQTYRSIDGDDAREIEVKVPCSVSVISATPHASRRASNTAFFVVNYELTSISNGSSDSLSSSNSNDVTLANLESDQLKIDIDWGVEHHRHPICGSPFLVQLTKRGMKFGLVDCFSVLVEASLMI